MYFRHINIRKVLQFFRTSFTIVAFVYEIQLFSQSFLHVLARKVIFLYKSMNNLYYYTVTSLSKERLKSGSKRIPWIEPMCRANMLLTFFFKDNKCWVTYIKNPSKSKWRMHPGNDLQQAFQRPQVTIISVQEVNILHLNEQQSNYH